MILRPLIMPGRALARRGLSDETIFEQMAGAIAAGQRLRRAGVWLGAGASRFRR